MSGARPSCTPVFLPGTCSPNRVSVAQAAQLLRADSPSGLVRSCKGETGARLTFHGLRKHQLIERRGGAWRTTKAGKDLAAQLREAGVQPSAVGHE